MIRKVDPKNFDYDYGGIHRGVFSGRLAGYHPFQKLEWDMYLLPGGVHIEQDVFSALAKAASVQGDTEFVVTDFETIPPHQVSVICDWDFHGFKQVLREYPLLHAVDIHMFGRSGTWGVICYVDDFSCIGSEESFSALFSDELGGKNAIKERFLEFSRVGWFVNEADKQMLLDSVGWGR